MRLKNFHFTKPILNTCLHDVNPLLFPSNEDLGLPHCGVQLLVSFSGKKKIILYFIN